MKCGMIVVPEEFNDDEFIKEIKIDKKEELYFTWKCGDGSSLWWAPHCNDIDSFSKHSLKVY